MADEPQKATVLEFKAFFNTGIAPLTLVDGKLVAGLPYPEVSNAEIMAMKKADNANGTDHYQQLAVGIGNGSLTY